MFSPYHEDTKTHQNHHFRKDDMIKEDRSHSENYKNKFVSERIPEKQF